MRRSLILFVIAFFCITSPSQAQWQTAGFSVPPYPYISSGGIFFSSGGLYIAPPPSYPIKYYSSFDTGKTWTPHTLPSNFNRSAIASIRFFDKLNGVIQLVEASALLLTKDGGQTWSFISFGGWDATFLGAPNNILQVVDGTIATSNNFGVSWSYRSIGQGSRSFAITPKGTVFAGHNPIQMSTDFGNTWQTKSGVYNLDAFSMDIGKRCDDSTIYVVNEWVRGTQAGEIYISNDNGNSFSTQFPNQPLGYFTGSMVTSRHAAFCGTSTNGIMRTTDKGKTWISIGGPGFPFDSRSIAAINDNLLFVVDSLGNLWRTDNCGGNPIKAPPPPKPQITSLSAKASSCDSGKTSASLMHTYCDALTVTEATLQGTDAGYFTLQPQALPVALGNGAKVNFNIDFNPKKEVRSFSAQIRVKGWYIFEYEDTVRIDTVIPVNGLSTPVAPVITASITYFDFNKLSTCLPPIDTIVTLTNRGCDTLSIIQGPGVLAPQFTLLTPLTFPIKLAPDSSIILRFRFKPTSTGLFNTTAKFTVEQQTLRQDISVTLAGEGERDLGLLNYAPKKFDFQSLSICSHDSTSGYVTNIGCDTIGLDVTQIFGDKDYKLTANSSQLTVKPKDTVRYIVYLNPAQKGLRQGYLVLNSNDGLRSRRDTVPFTVTVTDGTKIFSSSLNTLDFGTTTPCEDKDSSIVLRNTGCDTLRVSGFGLRGSGFGTNAKFPIIILPGKDTVIDVFTIVDTSGGKTTSRDTLTFTSDADNTLSPIPLTRTYFIAKNRDVGLYLDPVTHAGENQTFVSYDIKESSGKSFTGAGIKNVNFHLDYNSDLLEFNQAKSSSNLSSSDGRNFTLSSSPEISADANGVLASVGFLVYLTKDSATPIVMTTKNDTTHLLCSTMTLSQGGNAFFDYKFLCGERSIVGFMKGKMPTKIISIHPNPAQDNVEIDLHSQSKQETVIEIFNELGVKVFSGSRSLTPGANKIHLDTKDLPPAMYLIRIGDASQNFVKVK